MVSGLHGLRVTCQCCSSLRHLAEIASVRFLCCEVVLCALLCILQSSEGSRCAQPTLKEGGVMLLFLYVEYLHKLIVTLLHGRFVCSPTLMYPLNDLFVSVCTHCCLLSSKNINPILHYFVAQVVPALVIGSSFSRLPYPFDIPQLFSHAHLVYFLLQS